MVGRNEVRPYAVTPHVEHLGAQLMAPTRKRWPRVLVCAWITALTVALVVAVLGWYRAANGVEPASRIHHVNDVPSGWQWRTPASVDRARGR